MQNDSPTTLDIRKLALDLQTLWKQEHGLAPRPTPMAALIDGNITVKDLTERLARAGLEMYPDASGANFIRTIEAGNLHRELVKCERLAARAEREAHEDFLRTHTPVQVGGSRFQPAEVKYIRREDPDEQYDADFYHGDRS